MEVKISSKYMKCASLVRPCLLSKGQCKVYFTTLPGQSGATTFLNLYRTGSFTNMFGATTFNKHKTKFKEWNCSVWGQNWKSRKMRVLGRMCIKMMYDFLFRPLQERLISNILSPSKSILSLKQPRKDKN